MVKSSERKGKMREKDGTSCPRAPQLTPNGTFTSLEGSCYPALFFVVSQILEATCFIMGKTKLSRGHVAAGVTTDGWHVPSKRIDGLERAHHIYRSPKPLQSSPHSQVACLGGMVSLIFRGRTPPATALRRAGQTSLEAQILANSPHQEISLILDREGADAGHSPPSSG